MLVRSSWQAYAQASTRLSRLSQADLRHHGLVAHPFNLHRSRRWFARSACLKQDNKTLDHEAIITKQVRERKEELDRAQVHAYPRLKLQHKDLDTVPATIVSFRQADEYDDEDEHTMTESVVGRITSIRLSGKKLAFFHLRSEHTSMQLMLNYATLRDPKPSQGEFHDRCRLLRRGDHIMVEAKPAQTRDGEPSLQAVSMPVLQSPCLHRFPVSSEQRPEDYDPDAFLERHVDMLTSPDNVRILLDRHNLVSTIRKFLDKANFTEVQTPVLSAQAGGATARPFETTATEFSNRKLSLRVAPELWLKRLIIGGMNKVFEIGPCFRNEGLDKTHNPEFTTCEFYAAYWTLPKLQLTTERLIKTALLRFHCRRRQSRTNITRQLAYEILPSSVSQAFDSDEELLALYQGARAGLMTSPLSFGAIDFITALNTLLGVELPNLASPDAREKTLEIYRTKGISVPNRPTLPRLLDELSSQYLEPHCQTPTWIENIPECLSPLAKSFIHPTAPNNQPVAARAELFIRGKEVVNCYEEENDPFEQRRKFVEQQKLARDPDSGEIDDEAMKIDEGYIRALEWGLPPTGGWGMGIDRLLMLFTGKERIADVLTFGNLRAVTRNAEKWDTKSQNKV